MDRVSKGRPLPDPRELSRIPILDPRQGKTVFEPPGPGTGHWAGAPSATYDPDRGKFYLYRRIRHPRPVRGGECRIAESDDGISFTDVWSMTKDQLGDSPSIERSSLVRGFGGEWLLFISYVDPADGRWRIDRLTADSPDGFDPRRREPVLTAASTGTEGVKDPAVYKAAGAYWMYYAYAPTPPDADDLARGSIHETGDVFNTGLVLQHSAVAVSRDGLHFTRIQDVLQPPSDGWDSDSVRTTCVVWTPPHFTMFYDGKSHVRENYEEKCGYAIGFDLFHWYRVTTDAPALVAPEDSGSLRYMDALTVGTETFLYYEMSRPDGSHELRVNVVEG